MQAAETVEARRHKTHVIKCWPEFYEAIAKGEKTFDLRQDDRDYQVGDDVIQQEFRHGVGAYTGRECRCKITFVARGQAFEKFGLKPGFACLAIRVIE